MASKLTRTTTDHDEIRRWAEERGAEPAEVAQTARGGETGLIRLDFPGYGGEGSLEHITWDEWFQKFDASGLALVYQDRTARGQKSNFNKLIGRETAETHGARRRAGPVSSGTRARRAPARDTGRSKRCSGGTRSGHAATRTREAPRATVARLSGPGRRSEAASKRDTARKGAAGRGKASGRSEGKGGRRTTKRTGRSSRRSRR